MTPETNTSLEERVSEKRLWFGITAAVTGWVLAGLLDVLLAWQACMGGESGGAFSGTGIEIMLGCITFGFLVLGIYGGVVSYNNWRTLSEIPHFFEAEGHGRKQFMGLVGVLATLTLGVGIIWFSVPIYVLNVCMRWR